MSGTACMGGWCTKRDRCAHHLTDDRSVVAERLCEPGQEAPTHAQRTEDHKARLSHDPRFAGWAGLAPLAGPLSDGEPTS